MNTMYIGSGDVYALMSGRNSETHYKLLRRFVSGVKPYYNAKGSPIDALRTGAIIEDRYSDTLPEGYYRQYEVVCPEMDVLKCSLDFARIENGVVVDFDETKSCNFGDFLKFEAFRFDQDKGVEFIRKYYKANYNQLQQQLLCTGLESANMVFIAVYTYDDEENTSRVIQENEYIKFRIQRDEAVIEVIKDRAMIFQTLKNHYQ